MTARLPEDRPCSKCGRSEPEVRFGVTNKGRRLWCRDCMNAYDRSHYAEHGRDRSHREPADRRALYLKTTYGLATWQYDLMLARQYGACAICRRHFDYDLHVDHDHNTGVVRGLLCRDCNTRLGYVENNLELLPAMLQYLGILQGGD